MVLRELRKIKKRGSIETAKRVKGYVQSIFDRAEGEHCIGGGSVLAIAILAAAEASTVPSSMPEPVL